MPNRILFALLAALLLCWRPIASSADDAAVHSEPTERGLALFDSDVRAILAGRCVKCHGGESTEAGFDLSTREGLLAGGAGGAAVDLKNAHESRLYKLVSGVEEPAMPQDGAPLSAREIAALAEWVACGAPYAKPLVEKDEDPLAWIDRKIEPSDRQWWAFQPLAALEPPVSPEDQWSRTPIDRFLWANLRERGMSPNEAADRRTLIRRATFDLIGLPPTPEEVEAFAADESPEAYEDLIDRLLDSPHFGERWARHWLDVARFAESHGFEQDYDRPFAFHYRDFVIKAFNGDMPYDQFVKWQLAGDELAPRDPQALAATGFLGAGVFPTQITANEVERTRYDALDDMAATTGAAFLGLSVGCARCHDHKFDPIPQGDYYRFTSTFTTTVRGEIDVELDAEKHRVALAEFEKRIAPRIAERTAYEEGELAASFDQWRATEAEAFLSQPKWQTLEFTEAKSEGGATLTKQADGSILASGTNPDFDRYILMAELDWNDFQFLRLEALAHESLVKGGPGRAENGNFALSNLTATAQLGEQPPMPLALSEPQATFEQAGLPIAAAIDGDAKSAWAIAPKFGENHAASFRIEPASPLGGRIKLVIALEFQNNNKHAMGRVRLSLARGAERQTLDAEAMPQTIAAFLANPSAETSPQERETLLKWFAPRDARWAALDAAVQATEKDRPQPNIVKMMVCSEGIPAIRHHTQGGDFFEETFYLKRGDLAHKQVPAPAGFLQVLSSPDAPADLWKAAPGEAATTSLRRTALANWITDTERGPGELLARVIVNRLWQHHFGRGLVATPSDFGRQGAPPSHPDLLDWLARKLIDGGWRLKPLHKLMMASSAYRQTSTIDSAKEKIDPDNALLWRYPLRRLEAEAIRDAMLAISGSLDLTMFGPGSLDESHKRRSIYFTIKRSRLIPSMQLFDMPEPLVSVGDRPATTIAPQALSFMNNAQVREYSIAFAGKLLAHSGDPSEIVHRGYLATIGRPPDQEESTAAIAFLTGQTQSYAHDGHSDANRLALADLCQVWFGLNEFVFVR